ncbi:MAG: hypothetical protein AMXMBFR84_03110 [Candidatus Hydrogenedentota bacterium]
MRISGALLFVVAGVAALGCGKKTEENTAEFSVTTKDGTASVTMGDSGIRIQSPDGNVNVNLGGNADGNISVNVSGAEGSVSLNAGAAVAMPDNIPSDVPIYAGLTPTLVNAESTEQAFMIQATSGDAPSKIVQFYKDNAPKNGWKEASAVSETAGQETHMIAYEKDGRQMVIMATAAGAGSQVTLTCSGK